MSPRSLPRVLHLLHLMTCRRPRGLRPAYELPVLFLAHDSAEANEPHEVAVVIRACATQLDAEPRIGLNSTAALGRKARI